MTDNKPETWEWGFRVKLRRKDRHDKRDGWEVYLPHQCDEWSIAGGSFTFNGTSATWQSKTHAEVVAEFEDFIREANQALEALRNQQEYGNDEPSPLAASLGLDHPAEGE